MVKKLYRLFVFRVWKSSQLKPTLHLAVSRLHVLKNHRKVRHSQSRSDVVQLLKLAQQDRALIRVDQVIKEQNMLDAYVIMEGYLNLLIERLALLQHPKECPEELQEAIATLLFASSRCGDFPELQKIRSMFGSRYGKEFVTRCIQMPNQWGVNTKTIQKMSSLAPSLEAKTKLLVEIAAENNIVLQPFGGIEGGLRSSNLVIREVEDDSIKTEFTNPFRIRHKYKDVADAAQDAFENATYAAAAARAAVELSQTGGSGKLRRFGLRNPEEGVGSLKQIKSRLNADPDNVPRLNLDRRLISIRAKRVSGY